MKGPAERVEETVFPAIIHRIGGMSTRSLSQQNELSKAVKETLPAYLSWPCSRWKITKMRSKYWGSIPIPLSETAKRHISPAR